MAVAIASQPNVTSDLPVCPQDPTGKQLDILDAAATVFLREGFERASVDVIAAEANVSKRTIYNHFADKRALFLAVIGYKLHPSALATALDPANLRSAPTIRQDLTAIAHKAVEQNLLEESAALRRVLIADIMRFPELTGACQQLHPFSAAELLGLRLAELLSDRLSPELAVTAINQFLNVLFAQSQSQSAFWSIPVSAEKRERFIDSTVDLIVRAYNLDS